MSSIIRQHPVNSIINSDYLKKRKIADDDYIELDDYHHFDNIRRYLEDLAVTQPTCVSRCGRKKKLTCTCCSVFKFSSVACCVAAYLMEFGKQDKNTKKMIVIEWIRHLEMSDDIEGHQPYTLPYFPFSEYEDMLRSEGILSYDVPKNILYNHKVCKTAIMNIIAVGRDFWKPCKLMLEHGPEPSLLKNNQHALKKDMADDLDIFFEEMKELSEPIATVVVRDTTKEITKISLKNEEIDTFYLPPHYSKRSLYERYCYERGHVATKNNSGTYSLFIRVDKDWIESGDERIEVASFWTFFYHWKKT